MQHTHWEGKKVAFLGDSITDRNMTVSKKLYWQFLEDELGITPLVYGINGNRWIHVPDQTEKLIADHGTDLDAIFIFIGTNDYMGNIPLGEWFTHQVEETNYGGNMVKRSRRILSRDPETLRGRINNAMEFLKQTFPLQQIVLMTPIHRAFATFSETNVQPDETFPNALGLYIDDYIAVIREAADRWSCPLIDLYRDSGLYPLAESHGQFFSKPDTDRLHPNTDGHRRIARTMICKMLSIPSTFR